jgi:hypothetical protein
MSENKGYFIYLFYYILLPASGFRLIDASLTNKVDYTPYSTKYAGTVNNWLLMH